MLIAQSSRSKKINPYNNLEADLLLDVRVIGVQRWQRMAGIQAGLYRTISQDAIPLAG